MLLNMFKTLTIVLLHFVLIACASKQAGVVFHDNFDFSHVKSYSLYQRNSLFGETQSLLSAHRNAIEIAIERAMANKKFGYATIEQADVIVTYHLFTGASAEYSHYNKVVNFCEPCLRANTWQTKNQYKQVTRGNLVLDLVDPKQNRSVWRSVFPLNLDVKDNSVETNSKINNAVTSMLARYPHKVSNNKAIN
ncbi:hypothetical protein NBRC116592_17710 [Colwellia sp. KU-HH00111]